MFFALTYFVLLGLVSGPVCGEELQALIWDADVSVSAPARWLNVQPIDGANHIHLQVGIDVEWSQNKVGFFRSLDIWVDWKANVLHVLAVQHDAVLTDDLVGIARRRELLELQVKRESARVQENQICQILEDLFGNSIATNCSNARFGSSFARIPSQFAPYLTRGQETFLPALQLRAKPVFLAFELPLLGLPMCSGVLSRENPSQRWSSCGWCEIAESLHSQWKLELDGFDILQHLAIDFDGGAHFAEVAATQQQHIGPFPARSTAYIFNTNEIFAFKSSSNIESQLRKANLNFDSSILPLAENSLPAQLVERSCHQPGFHKALTTRVKLLGLPSPQDCTALFLEHLPAGLYVDVYEIAAAKGIDSDIFVFDDIDIERPVSGSTQNIVAIQLLVVDGWANVTIPMHIRYRSASVNDYDAILLQQPKLFLNCYPPARNRSRCQSSTSKQFPSKITFPSSASCGNRSTDFDWITVDLPPQLLVIEVPVGPLNFAPVVSLLTFGSTICGSIIVVASFVHLLKRPKVD